MDTIHSHTNTSALQRLKNSFIHPQANDSLYHAQCLIALLETTELNRIDVDDKTSCGLSLVMALIDILIEQSYPAPITYNGCKGQ